MTLLNKLHFVCLDCEFTGLDMEKDRIIEIAAVKFTFSEIVSEFDELIQPDCPISKDALEIHHISSDMLVNKPHIEEILPKLFSFVDKNIIVGHAIKSDLEMLSRAAKRAGLDSPLDSAVCIDTLRLARLYGDSPNNSLENLAKHFNVPVEKMHRALHDVIMNIDVFKHLVRKFKTLDQLQKSLSKPIKMKYMPLGKYKGRIFKEIPIHYLRWASNMDFDEDLLYTIRLELNARKKGDGFANVCNPFSGL